jgi:hypothetical protein
MRPIWFVRELPCHMQKYLRASSKCFLSKVEPAVLTDRDLHEHTQQVMRQSCHSRLQGTVHVSSDMLVTAGEDCSLG